MTWMETDPIPNKEVERACTILKHLDNQKGQIIKSKPQ
jgi:hypothetical protein